MRPFLVIAAVVSASVLSPAALVAADDPLVWEKPAAPPPFRPLLKDEEFTARRKKLLDALGELSVLEKSPLPEFGFRIVHVDSDGLAARLNLRVGDIIFKVDDHELRGPKFAGRDWRDRLECYSDRDRKNRTVSVQPGLLGIRLDRHARPELGYLRGTNRNPRWDRDVLTGIVAAESDPDLAETAWNRALMAGYPRDSFCSVWGATLALAQGRPEVAADFAWFPLDEGRKARRFEQPLPLFRAAIANYKLREAVELARAFPDQFVDDPETLEALVAVHQARSADRKVVSPPSVVAKSMLRENLLNRLVPLDYSTRIVFLPLLRGTGNLKFRLEAYHKKAVWLGTPTPVRNVELHVRYRMAPTSAAPAGDKRVFVGLVNPDVAPEEVERGGSPDEVLAVEAFVHNPLRISQGFPPTNVWSDDASLKTDGSATNDVRIVCVNGQAEIFVNDKRILYAPVSDVVSRLAFRLEAGSVTGLFESVEIHELIEKP